MRLRYCLYIQESILPNMKTENVRPEPVKNSLPLKNTMTWGYLYASGHGPLETPNHVEIYLRLFAFSCSDAYSTRDIVYEWLPGEVAVGSKELAQFQYKGATLSSDFDVYSTGGQKALWLYVKSSWVVLHFVLKFNDRVNYQKMSTYFAVNTKPLPSKINLLYKLSSQLLLMHIHWSLASSSPQ